MDIPIEIWTFYVLPFLSPRDISSLLLTSHAFREIIQTYLQTYKIDTFQLNFQIQKTFIKGTHLLHGEICKIDQITNRIRLKITYFNGTLHGEKIKHRHDGELKARQRYRNGRLEGWQCKKIGDLVIQNLYLSGVHKEFKISSTFA